MSIEMEVAADRLRRAIADAEPCEEDETCAVAALSDAAQELLDELRREKLIPTWL
jgi:hypothetical protein